MATQEQIIVVQKELINMESQFAKAMGGNTVEAQRFSRALQTALRKTPKIAECNIASVRQCAMDCAQIKLTPNTPQQLAALIPYGNECTMQIMYKGWVDLVLRSGKVATIKAVCVYKQDQFEIREGTEQQIIHVPNYDHKFDGKDLVGTYAFAKVNGEPIFVYMSANEINTIRLRSSAVKNNRSSPWDTDLGEMFKKTVLKRLCKILPQNEDLSKAIELDDVVETGKSHKTVVDGDIVYNEVEPDPVVSKEAVAVEAMEVKPEAPKSTTPRDKAIITIETILSTLQEDVSAYWTDKMATLNVASRDKISYAQLTDLQKELEARFEQEMKK
jgi:recombination protein RecT